MDSKVEELNELEQEKAEGDSDDKYTEELLKELREDMEGRALDAGQP